jgi:DNA-binding transcriptional ArsR family regulator
MNIDQALVAFDALSQETRLRVFRLLVEHGVEGVSAGMVSQKLGVAPNSLSFHLTHMANAGLINARREGRSIIYAANFDFFSGLIRYMVEDCCNVEFASIRNDKKKGCSIIELNNCCVTKTKEKKL